MGDIFFHVGIFLKLTPYHERVSMLSFMLFLDFSSDHWKFESLLLCFRKPYGENSCTGIPVQGVLFGMKPYKMLVLPICMAKQVKFVEFRPNEAFSSICVFFYISMSNF